MIKVQNNTAVREPVPAFLAGLLPESLLDLSWTDPALGVQDCAWWPEVDQSPALQQYERYGAETLTVDAGNQRVIVTRTIVPWSEQEIAADAEAKRKAAVPRSISPRQVRQALTRVGLRAAVEAAVAGGDQDIKDWWEFATAFERDNQHVIEMAAALGVTERQLDDLWTLGGSL